MGPSPICRRPPPPTAVISGHTQPIGVSPVRHVPPEFHHRGPDNPAVSHYNTQGTTTRHHRQTKLRANPARGPSPETRPEATASHARTATGPTRQRPDQRISPRGHQPTEPSLSASRSPPQTPAQPSQPPDIATPAKAATTPTTGTQVQISLHRHLRRRRPAQPSQTAATRPKPFARKNPRLGEPRHGDRPSTSRPRQGQTADASSEGTTSHTAPTATSHRASRTRCPQKAQWKDLPQRFPHSNGSRRTTERRGPAVRACSG